MTPVLIILLFFSSSISSDDDHLPDASCLSELPLDRLLHIKRTFSRENWGVTTESRDDEEESCPESGGPEAQALVMATSGQYGPLRRGGHGHTGWASPSKSHHKSKSSKKSKIVSKIFQGTITALSFLAFGGYVLCIIVRAIRQKLADVTVTVNGTVVIGRRRRDLQSWDAMYQALISLSKGYAAYHQVPYDDFD